jgi:hypothetical protein
LGWELLKKTLLIKCVIIDNQLKCIYENIIK